MTSIINPTRIDCSIYYIEFYSTATLSHLGILNIPVWWSSSSSFHIFEWKMITWEEEEKIAKKKKIIRWCKWIPAGYKLTFYLLFLVTNGIESEFIFPGKKKSKLETILIILINFSIMINIIVYVNIILRMETNHIDFYWLIDSYNCKLWL